MALFVIVAGALLILGGIISLLSGFDIVMTERGSAMTIGGTIALSGGVIAMGIGFSLLRLSQILAALETATAEDDSDETSARITAEDRSVTTASNPVSAPAVIGAPKLPSEAIELKQAGKSTSEEDTILVSPLSRQGVAPEIKRPGFLKSSGLATAGILAAGAASVAAKKSDNNDKPSEPETQAHASEASVDVTDIDETKEPAPEAARDELTGLDLDEALSKALAEDLEAADLEKDASLPSSEPEETQAPADFNKGLSEMLAKPKKRGRKALPAADLDAEELDAEEDVMAAEMTAQPATPSADSDSSPDEEKMTDAISMLEVLSDTEDADEVKKTVVSKAPSVPETTVIGTYNAEDGTYIMYSNGTVEAITEQGVRMFKSMEELRKHLTKS